MARKILINMVLESEYTSEMEKIEVSEGEMGLHNFARNELQKLLDSEDTDAEWGAGIFSIVVK